MGQGSINMPAPGRSPIEGIMQALQAVHNFYGIDTEKAQQKLLASQNEEANQKTRLTKAEADKASVLAQGAKDVSEGNSTGAAAVYLGLVPKMKSQAAPASNPQAPQSPNFTPVNNTPQDSSQPFTPVSGPKTASNDNGLVDTGSPLMSILPPKQSLQSKKQAGASGASMWQVSSPDGTVTEYGLKPEQELEYTKKQADLEKTKTDTQHVKQEMEMAPQKQKQDFVKGFDDESKELRSSIQTAKQASNALLSGNKVSEKLGQLKATMAQLAIKRINSGTGELGAPSDAESQLDALLERADTGHLTAPDIDVLNKSINGFQKATEENLIDLAKNHSLRAPELIGMKSDQAFKKLLLPSGTGAKYTDTIVDGGQLFKVNPDGSKGSLVYYDTPTEKHGPLVRAILGAGMIGKEGLSKLTGGIGHLVGGGE